MENFRKYSSSDVDMEDDLKIKTCFLLSHLCAKLTGCYTFTERQCGGDPQTDRQENGPGEDGQGL